MSSWLKGLIWILGLMIVAGLIWSYIYSKDLGDRYTRIREKAVNNLLADAPLGSDFDFVVEVLKKQNYRSEWKLDEDGVLVAVTDYSVLTEFTWRLGPTRWDLVLRCKFEDGKLDAVESDMRPDCL
jgi:hypothetical protein